MNQFREKSDEAWNAAWELLSNSRVNSAANRIYYALFQAVFGFGIQQDKMKVGQSGQKESKHTQARDVARDAEKGRYHSRTLQELKALRETADYTPEGVNSKELEEWRTRADEARRFYLRKSGERI